MRISLLRIPIASTTIVPLCVESCPFAPIIPVHNRRKVKCCSVDSSIRGAANSLLDALVNILILVVKYERKIVLFGVSGRVARLVNEYVDSSRERNLQEQERRRYPPALDGSPYVETHNVGGNPPTLDSPLLRGDHLSYTTNRRACTKVAGGKPPAFGSPLCVEDHLSYTTAEDLMGGPRRSQELLANLSQVVSRKAPLVPKESMISRIVGMPFIPKGCEFDSAHVICNLGKIVVTRQSLSIDSGALRQAGAYRSMHRVRNNPLSVVVVHLYLVKLLKEGKVLLEESDEILFDRLGKGVYAAIFALPIAQREVVERHLLNQDVESNQIAFARFNVEIFVLLVSAKDRGEMESLFWKAGVAQRLLEFEDSFGDVRRLVVKYEGDQIVLGAVSDVSRFIDEDRELSHQAAPSLIKMPRDTPRLRDSPPCVESYPFYTTSRSAESIVCESEHKFVTIEANTCSTYRVAA